MFKFLKHLSLILIGYAVFAFSASAILYHCGLVTPRDEALSELKLQAVEESNYSLLMIGSSRFYRQLDSVLIEDRLRASGHELSVFNLGVPGLWSPRLDTFLDRVENATSSKVLLVELNGPKSLFGNLRSGSVIRSIDLFDALEVLSISREMNSDTRSSLKLNVSYLAALLYKYSGIGLFRFALGDSAEAVNDAKRRLSYADNGYLSLDQELAMKLGNRARQASNTSQLDQRRQENIEKYTNPQDGLSTTLLAKCETAIDRAQSHGCQLVYVLPPRIGESDLSMIYGVFRELPASNKIDLSDPTKYPEFYSPQYSFDIGHLNEAGAQIMSAALVEKLDTILEPVVQSRN